MSDCTDPDCPHDVFDHCPKELGAAVLEGRKKYLERKNLKRRERNFELILWAILGAIFGAALVLIASWMSK